MRAFSRQDEVCSFNSALNCAFHTWLLELRSPWILACSSYFIRKTQLPNTSAFPAFNSSDHVALVFKSNGFVENPGKFDSSSSWCKFVRLWKKNGLSGSTCKQQSFAFFLLTSKVFPNAGEGWVRLISMCMFHSKTCISNKQTSNFTPISLSPQDNFEL